MWHGVPFACQLRPIIGPIIAPPPPPQNSNQVLDVPPSTGSPPTTRWQPPPPPQPFPTHGTVPRMAPAKVGPTATLTAWVTPSCWLRYFVLATVLPISVFTSAPPVLHSAKLHSAVGRGRWAGGIRCIAWGRWGTGRCATGTPGAPASGHGRARADRAQGDGADTQHTVVREYSANRHTRGGPDLNGLLIQKLEEVSHHNPVQRALFH